MHLTLLLLSSLVTTMCASKIVRSQSKIRENLESVCENVHKTALIRTDRVRSSNRPCWFVKPYWKKIFQGTANALQSLSKDEAIPNHFNHRNSCNHDPDSDCGRRSDVEPAFHFERRWKNQRENRYMEAGENGVDHLRYVGRPLVQIGRATRRRNGACA